MQVLCRKTNGNAECHCCVCGQGFVMFWDRQPAAERAAVRREMQETLRRQHRSCPGREAHPQDAFLVPEWKGSNWNLNGATMPGNAPVWDL